VTKLVCSLIAALFVVAVDAAIGECQEAQRKVAGDKAAGHWTILFYGAGADEKHLVKTVGVIKDSLVDGQGVEVIALVDRPGKYVDGQKVLGDDFKGTRIYRVSGGAERLAGGREFPELTAAKDVHLPTADAGTLAKFIRFGKTNYPAQKYALVFFGHGCGYRFCPDKSTGQALEPAKVRAVLSNDESVDLVVFDVCFMGGIEVAYEWRPGNGRFEASFMVASPSLGDALPYERILPRLRSGGPDHLDPAGLTALAFGKQIVADAEAHRRDELQREPMYALEAWACYDLSRAGKVKQAVDAFAVELGQTQGAREILGEIRGSGAKPVAMNYLDPEGIEKGWAWHAVPYFDLYDVARRVGESRSPSGVKEKSAAVGQAVQQMIACSFGQKHYAGFEPGKNGVYIVLPDGAALRDGKRDWQRCGWYTPLAVRNDKNLYGRWAWCQDGATPGNGRVENWFELLDSWYDTTNDATGGSNGYRW
jgi:clostripain